MKSFLNQHAIIILGMHRSGTSALTRVLNLLGMELGQPLLPPHSTNITGFWEHAEIVAINEQILRLLGSHWEDDKFFKETDFNSNILKPLRQHAAKIIYQNFSNCRLWGVKDPRFCKLLPFWLPILAETGCQLHFILMARHPIEVAASLKQRNDFTNEKSLKLWLTHTLSSERDSRYHSRTFISYQELLTNWMQSVEKIAAQLKITWSNSPKDVADAVEKFLVPCLKHHDYQNKIEDNLDNPLFQTCLSVYEHFQQLSAKESISFTLFDSYYQQFSHQERYITPIRIHLIVYIREDLEDFSKLLHNTLQAFQSQHYPHCHLSILTHYPITAEFSSIAQLYSIQSLKNQSIELVTEQEIRIFHADWVAFIDAGDTFAANLFSSCIEYITFHPYWRCIYVDENILTLEGEIYSSHLKPDINLFLLRSTPYIGHFCLIHRETLHIIGGYQFDYGWKNEDICFKVLEKINESAIGHIPQLLYYRQMRPETQDFRPIIEQHLVRQHIIATVHLTDFENIYQVDYQIIQPTLISIIIATRNEINTLQRCLQNITKMTNYQHYEIIVVDNASDETLQLNYYNNQAVYLLRAPQEMPLSILYNQAARQAHGAFLLFLNDDIEVTQPKWLESLLSINQQSNVGIVGARIIDSQQHVLQAGYILGMGKIGVAGQIHQGLFINELGYQGRAQTTQQFSALSDHVMMIKKDVYHQVGGMSEDKYVNLFGEIDLCLKVIQKDYKVVWTPAVTVKQNGVGSIIRQRTKLLNDDAISYEITNIYQNWLPELSHDRYYHPNLSLSDQAWQLDTRLLATWQFSENRQKSALSYSLPRIIAFSQDTQAVGEYRVRAPLRMLQKHGLVEYALMPVNGAKNVNLTELERLQGDVLLLHNFLHNHQLNLLHQCQKHSHYFKIFGQDDLGYAISQFNPYYHTNYKDMQSRIFQTLRMCDRLIVSTEPLADAYCHCINDIVIIPNYIEFSRWQGIFPQSQTHGKPRVGWAGAAQHLEDLQLIVSVVKKLAKQVDWIFFGMCPKELHPYLCEYHPMVSFEQYPSYLAKLNLDLAIAPLSNNAFNEAKSNLRLLEYGMLSYPVVCSDIYPYRNAPVTRVQNTEQAWINAILEHLYNQETSQKIGAQLRQWVLENYLLENHINVWESGLNSSSTTKYRFETATPQIKWMFILSTHVDAVEHLKSLLNQHPNVKIVSAAEIRSLQLPKEVIHPDLWTEYLQKLNLPLSEKNLEIINSKQLWYRSFDADTVTACIISDIPADMARTLILQQHFRESFFIYISSEIYSATQALYQKLKQFLNEPLLLQRATLQYLRGVSHLNKDRSELQHFLTIAYEDLLNNPKVSLEQVSNFLNLTAYSYIVPENLFSSSRQQPLTPIQQAMIDTVVRQSIL